MEYFLLAGACICFSVQFIFSKLFQKRTDGTVHASMWSNLLSGTAMFIIFFCINGFKIGFSWTSAGLALIYALSSIICTCASIIGMTSTTVAAMTLYTLLGGVVLPFFYGVIRLGEHPSVFRWIGVSLMVSAAVIPYVINSFEKKEIQTGNAGPSAKNRKLTAAVCCALVFLTNGLISIATKAASTVEDAIGENDFMLLGTVVRIAGSVLILIFLALKAKSKNPLPVDPITNAPANAKAFTILFLISFFYAVLNGAGNIFSLNCAKTMDASLQFPIISAACIIFTAVIGLIAFKEKPGKGDLIGIVIATAGIIFSIF